MDRIELRGLRVFAHHGVQPQERRDGQTFLIDVTLELDSSASAVSDRLEDTVDYAALAQRLADAATGTSFQLLEALADHLARDCLDDPRVAAAEVRVAKPDAPMPVPVEGVAVVRRRERRSPGAAAHAHEMGGGQRSRPASRPGPDQPA